VKEDTDDYHGAIECYDKVIEIDSNYTEAYINRRLILDKLYDHKRMLDDFYEENSIEENYDEVGVS
jgi:lipoprotein NlpI